jgi:hypothetical protein
LGLPEDKQRASVGPFAMIRTSSNRCPFMGIEYSFGGERYRILILTSERVAVRGQREESQQTC